MKPRVCNDRLKVIIPVDTEECEFWLTLVKSTDEIENPDRNHAWITRDNVFYVYNGKELVAINDPNTLKVKWGHIFGNIEEQSDLYEILQKTIWTVNQNGKALDFDYVNHKVDVNVPIMTLKLNGNELKAEDYVVNIDLSDYALATNIPTKLSELSNDSNFITQDSLNSQIKVKSISENTVPLTADDYGNVDITAVKSVSLNGTALAMTDGSVNVTAVKSISVNGTAQTQDSNGNVDITVSSGGSDSGTTSLKRLSIQVEETASGDSSIQTIIGYDGSEAQNVIFIGGDNVKLTSDGSSFVKVNATNTTYSDATSSVSGLMSATDKAKLDALPTFYSGTDSEPTGTFNVGDIYFQLES